MNKKRKYISAILLVCLAIFGIGAFGLWRHWKQSHSDPKEISVAYCFDKKYTLPTLVSATSLMENLNKDTHCKFTFVLAPNVTGEDKERINSLKNKYKNCSVNLVDAGDAFRDSEIGFWSTAMYYRLKLPEILKDEKMCLYIDSDTVIRQNIAPLFNTDMRNYCAAGIHDMNKGHIYKGSEYSKVLEIDNVDSYICSGVLLMNLEKIRNEGYDTKLMDWVEKNCSNNKGEGKAAYPDQNAINVVLYGKILNLPFKYGALTHVNFELPYEESSYAQWVSNKHDWEEGRKNPAIVHFTHQKPWTDANFNTIKFAEEWWKYARTADCTDDEISGIFDGKNFTYHKLVDTEIN